METLNCQQNFINNSQLLIFVQVVVSAKDLGEPANQATCILRIKVTDVNDNAPIFINPGYDNTTVYASIKVKKPFINIKVSVSIEEY